MDAALPFEPRPDDAPAAGGVGWLLRGCGSLTVAGVFTGVGLLDAPVLREVAPLGFFGLIVACLLVARWLPALLVRLTHAPRDPFPPRRNRGFRLW